MDIELRSETARAFVDALHTVEESRDPAALADLVTDQAEVLSIDGHGARHGPDGMRELFAQYLAQFDEIRTTFTRATEQSGRTALEWSSQAVLIGGDPARYTGVTVIETSEDKVTSFRTLYDSAALLRPRAGGGPTRAPETDTAGGGSAGDDAADGDAAGADAAGGAGMYAADSGFLPEADREAATGSGR